MPGSTSRHSRIHGSEALLEILLTDAVTIGESKDAFDLIESHVLLNLNHISVKLWDELGRKRDNCYLQ